MASAKAAGAKSAWQDLVGGRGYVGISLHSRNHQGDGLAAIVDWMNTVGKFETVRIGLSDTLNRHNYAHANGGSLKEAYTKAARNGDEWLSKNRRILDNLDMPYDLVRWSHWLEKHSDEVERNRVLFQNVYEENSAFRASVDTDISAYLSRTNDNCDAKSIDASRRYLIEELAVYSVILREFPATTVYPGKQLHCFAFMRENKPEGLPRSIGETGFIRLGIHGLRDDHQQPPASRIAPAEVLHRLPREVVESSTRHSSRVTLPLTPAHHALRVK